MVSSGQKLMACCIIPGKCSKIPYQFRKPICRLNYSGMLTGVFIIGGQEKVGIDLPVFISLPAHDRIFISQTKCCNNYISCCINNWGLKARFFVFRYLGMFNCTPLLTEWGPAHAYTHTQHTERESESEKHTHTYTHTVDTHMSTFFFMGFKHRECVVLAKWMIICKCVLQ